MEKKPERTGIAQKAWSGGAGSKEDLGGATSKPAMKSRAQFSPAEKAEKDISEGRVTDARKKRSPEMDDFERKSKGGL